MPTQQIGRLIGTALMLCCAVTRHLPAADQSITTEQQAALQRSREQIKQLCRQDKFEEAIPLAKSNLEFVKDTVGPEHPLYSDGLKQLAWLYAKTRQFPKAIICSRELRALRKEQLGTKHPDYAEALNDLAGLYAETQQLDKAKPLFEETIAIRKETLGVKDPDYATSLNNLAGVYAQSGELAQGQVALVGGAYNSQGVTWPAAP